MASALAVVIHSNRRLTLPEITTLAPLRCIWCRAVGSAMYPAAAPLETVPFASGLAKTESGGAPSADDVALRFNVTSSPRRVLTATMTLLDRCNIAVPKDRITTRSVHAESVSASCSPG